MHTVFFLCGLFYLLSDNTRLVGLSRNKRKTYNQIMTTQQEEQRSDTKNSKSGSPSEVLVDTPDSKSNGSSDDDNIGQSEELSDKEIYTVEDRPPEYWAQRKKKFVLDVDPKYAKQKDKSDTYKRFKYLLGVTDLFRHFIGIKAKHDKNIQNS